MMVNYILGGLIALVMFFAIRKVVRDFSSGGCSCGCGGCPEANKCASAKQQAQSHHAAE